MLDKITGITVNPSIIMTVTQMEENDLRKKMALVFRYS